MNAKHVQLIRTCRQDIVDTLMVKNAWKHMSMRVLGRSMKHMTMLLILLHQFITYEVSEVQYIHDQIYKLGY